MTAEYVAKTKRVRINGIVQGVGFRPFIYQLANQYNLKGEVDNTYLNLTPTEIQTANLIKQGKTSKEIAELVNLSTRTVEFHRDNIRKKMGVKNKKVTLRTHFLSIQ